MAYYYSPFRKSYDPENKQASAACIFCDSDVINKQLIRNGNGQSIENEHYFWLVNYFPKFEGHTIILPKRHIASIEDESADEVLSRNQLEKFSARVLQELYPGAGIEVFLQYGEGSASSVPHLHWHVVPSMPDDNLRSFEKLGHFYTKEKDREKVVLFPMEIKKAKEDLQNDLAEILGGKTLSKN